MVGCAHSAPKTNQKAIRFQAEGVAAYQQNDLDRAAGLFSLALEYDPRMAEARSGLGLVALARGDKATAEQQFKTALQYNEELAEAHHNLGQIDLERGEYDEAMKRFRQALAIDPGFGPARMGVSDALLQLGRPDEARWELAKLTDVDPHNAGAQALYALVLAQLNRMAAAEAAAQKALALDPKLGAAHRARGEILKRRGDFAGAAEEFRFVLQGAPMSVDDRVSLVTMLVLAGKRDEADVEAQSLEKQAPARPEVPFVLAFIAINREEVGPAIQYATRALRLRPRYPQARMILAEALLRAGQTDEGKRQLQQFINEAPPSMEFERRRANEFLGR